MQKQPSEYGAQAHIRTKAGPIRSKPHTLVPAHRAVPSSLPTACLLDSTFPRLLTRALRRQLLFTVLAACRQVAVLEEPAPGYRLATDAGEGAGHPEAAREVPPVAYHGVARRVPNHFAAASSEADVRGAAGAQEEPGAHLRRTMPYCTPSRILSPAGSLLFTQAPVRNQGPA